MKRSVVLVLVALGLGSGAGEAVRLGPTRFDALGAHLPSVSIGLGAIGRAGAMREAEDAVPVTVGLEVRLARAPGVVEWWRSLPTGLEQGVTIETRPAGEGPLRLSMRSPGARVASRSVSSPSRPRMRAADPRRPSSSGIPARSSERISSFSKISSSSEIGPPLGAAAVGMSLINCLRFGACRGRAWKFQNCGDVIRYKGTGPSRRSFEISTPDPWH